MRICKFLIFVVVLSTSITSAFSQEETISIRFQKLQEFAIANSPEIEQINQDYNLRISKGKSDLEWSNPIIGYSQEFIKNSSTEERTQYVTLSKQFESPWVYSLRKDSWKLLFQAAEHEKEEKINKFISELKSGFVEIKLLEEQKNLVNDLKNIISRTAEVAESQHEEGWISGVEKQLIKISLFNLDSRLLELKQKKRDIESIWKVKVGVPENTNIQYTTEIDFRPVALKTADYYLSSIPETPGFIQRETSIEAAQKQVNLEKSSLFPNFTLFGGYERVNPDFNGFIVGISLPIPLLSTNKPQIREQQVELNLRENELVSYKLKAKNEIKVKLSAINDYKNSLEKNSTEFKSAHDIADKVMFSYREGQISLTDTLNAIQIFSESNQQYYQLLTNYYHNIFQLEALINEQLILF